MDVEPLNKLLNKKMSRKDFLVHVGAAAVAVSGIAAIIKNIAEPKGKKTKPPAQKSQKTGYGQSPYGI